MAQGDTPLGEFLSGAPGLAAYLGSDPAAVRYMFVPGVPIMPEPLDPSLAPVGIIDSGVPPSHPQIGDRLLEARSITTAEA